MDFLAKIYGCPNKKKIFPRYLKIKLKQIGMHQPKRLMNIKI